MGCRYCWSKVKCIYKREAGQDEGRTRARACVRQQTKRDNKDTKVFQGPLGEDGDVEKWHSLVIIEKVNDRSQLGEKSLSAWMHLGAGAINCYPRAVKILLTAYIRPQFQIYFSHLTTDCQLYDISSHCIESISSLRQKSQNQRRMLHK